tara:strand:- start:731 stop:1024 length:294 start_codon:yes stop_codon:yes gene_type:complete
MCQKMAPNLSNLDVRTERVVPVGVVQIVRRRIQALVLPEDTLKYYFNYRETPAPNTKHQSPITKRFEFDSGADFFGNRHQKWIPDKSNYNAFRISLF